MKKILSLFTIICILCGCSVKKDDLYQLSFNNQIITVGYDNEDSIKGIQEIEEYQSILNKKKEYILSSIVLYIDNNDVQINNFPLSNGLKNTCSYFNGTIEENNGISCVIHNKVNKKENVIILYSDILSDDIDIIDHITISYR